MATTAAAEHSSIQPRCRTCGAAIDVWRPEPVCAAGHAAPRTDSVLDLRLVGDGFADWWDADDVERQRFLDETSRHEEIHQERLMRRLVQPLLAERGQAGGRVLSVGCGCGNDVETLVDVGFDAWGVDVGGRSITWERRAHAKRLVLAGADALPFPDAAFDAVVAIDVLEHIGTEGDSATLASDGAQQRQAAAREMMRVTRPGGLLLLSGPNRYFPADPFHRQMKMRFGVRWHGWNERFLLSYGDHERLFCRGNGCDAIDVLPLDRFFSFTRARRVPGVGLLVPAVEAIFRCLPPAFYRSPLNPFLIVLLERRAQ
jgi:SAM-dependent methyltransferase